MPRRERPNVAGRDPAYSHTFQAKRPPLPNGMPPTVRIPLADDDLAVEPPAPPAEDAAAPPPFEPDAPEAKARAAASPDPAPEAPEAATEDRPPKAKPPKVAKPKLAATTPQAVPEPEPLAGAPTKDMRRVTIKAAITSAHVEAIKPLVANGLAQRDVLAVAGRRAMKRFDPVAKFVPLPEGDRVALAQGYVTSKLIDADLLDGLRKVHDPLRLQSDAAMVRGQFETLFWSVLDEVIEELRQQKG